MKIPEMKTIIEIEGIYLSEDAIAELKLLQANKNAVLEDRKETVMTVISLLVENVETTSGEEKKSIIEELRNITLLRDTLNKLKKP